MPVLGVPFFLYQARNAIRSAMAEDRAFVSAMGELGALPDRRLRDQSERMERYVIERIGFCAVLFWVSAFVLGYGRLEEPFFLFLGSTIGTMLIDFVVGRLATQRFEKIEDSQ